MIISLIAAVDEQWGIGFQGRLPWKLSSDLRRFRALTSGHHLIMGRRTWDSIARPLPDRVNIIVSAHLTEAPPGCRLVKSLQEALALASQEQEIEVFIIGGGQIFAEALPLANRIYLTRVHSLVDADVFFPAIDLSKWQITEQLFVPAGAKDEFDSTFIRYERYE